MVRFGRLLAVARYEATCHMTGRQALRLVGVAAALLLPASAVTMQPLRTLVLGSPPGAELPTAAQPWGAGPPPPPKVGVRGTIPPGLEGRFEPDEDSAFELRGDRPVTVAAPYVSGELRAALETIDGPKKLEVRTYTFKAQLPGRSLLIAILAISLLTGPLADALPGERARRTLEVLMTTGITRGELVGGKWLAWTITSSTTALVAAAVACWRGVQDPGLWVLGLPLFVASAVALGLWLVRLVDDVVGGSAAPMRVLPVAAGASTVFAYAVKGASPTAAAAVPLGGPLLVAADLFQSPSQLVAAAAGTAAFVAVVLAWTGRDLDRVDTTSSPTRWGAVGLSAVATLLWWLSVAGSRVWGSGITTDLVTPMPESMLIGGLALVTCACVAIAREVRSGDVVERRSTPLASTVVTTLAVAAALAASGPLPGLDVAPQRLTVLDMLARMREAAVPTIAGASAIALAGSVLSVLGQALLFRGVVAARAGWITASLVWCLAVCPLSPWSAIAASLALGALAVSHGTLAALVAHALWTAAASFGWTATSMPAALAAQAIALAIAFGAARFARGEPSRHQS